MRARWWIGPVGMACALLAGCAEQQQHSSVSPENGLVLIQTGAPILACREACLVEWRRVQPQAAALAASGQWRDLATLVIRAGYQDDLSLYYLARAAEGMGFSIGAAKYYQQSTELSGTAIGCANLSKQCGGLSLPQAARDRLAELDKAAKRVRRPAAPPPPAGGATPAAPPPDTGTPAGTPTPAEAPPAAAAEPPPVASQPTGQPAPAPAPPSPSPRVSAPPLPRDSMVPRAGDYIEPPPAGR